MHQNTAAAHPPQTEIEPFPPQVLATLRVAVDEADPYLRDGSRAALIEVRTIAKRIAPLHNELPTTGDIRAAMQYVIRTITWWRNGRGVRAAWTWLAAEVAKAESEGTR